MADIKSIWDGLYKHWIYKLMFFIFFIVSKTNIPSIPNVSTTSQTPLKRS